MSNAFRSLPRAQKSPTSEACSIFSYKNEKVWRLIWCIKYKKSFVAAKIAGYAIFQILSYFLRAATPLILVPMPITLRRRRERGFNQCELILDEIEKLDMNNRVFISRNLLKRTRHKSRQTLKDREERLESAKDIFDVNDEIAEKLRAFCGESETIPEAVIYESDKPTTDEKNYLLIVIDDVITTGSTIRDAVITLRKAGFKKAFGLSVAH